MSSRTAVPLLLPLLLLVTCGPVAGDAIHESAAADRRLENGILDLIATLIRHYLLQHSHGGGDRIPLDVNLMLGVSVVKGQLKSCTSPSRMSYESGLDRKHILTTMIDNLYDKFYENRWTDSDTTRKMLDYRHWMSPPKIIHKSHITLPRDFNEDSIANGDLQFRNVSDECIRQLISTCDISPECVQLEITDDFSGYALTHQVLYIHIFKKMKCINPMFQQMADKLIRHKCSMIFNEAQYIAKDSNMLEKYKDLFIEQIAICGVQNMVDFIRPEWLSVMSTKIYSDCIQHKNASCDSHFTGVSLASLGVYWKFLCYKANTYGSY